MKRLKLTLKQFNEALEEAGMDPKIYDLADILNALSLYLSHEADRMKASGHEAGAELYRERSNGIYNYLDRLGFYDDI